MRNGMVAAMKRMPDEAHRLVPFVLLSLLLHAALLLLVRWPVHRPALKVPRPLTVTFAVPADNPAVVPAPVRRLSPGAGKPVSRRKAPAVVHAPASPRPALQPQAETAPVQPEARVVAPAMQNFDALTLREAARDIVRDEARKIEQQIVAKKERRANSPIGMMEQRLRLTGKEIRLANGMLKIRTAAGEVCFQPVPYYARDQAGLYGIPMTCP